MFEAGTDYCIVQEDGSSFVFAPTLVAKSPATHGEWLMIVAAQGDVVIMRSIARQKDVPFGSHVVHHGTLTWVVEPLSVGLHNFA